MLISSRLFLTLVILFSSPAVLFAGGSITLDDLQSLLAQQPKLWHFYQAHFDISPNGSGLRLGADGIPLRGDRVAPFEFPARMKGDPAADNLKLTIYADTYFFDAKGQETSDEMKAISKKEVLTGISVGPLKLPTLQSVYSPK